MKRVFLDPHKKFSTITLDEGDLYYWGNCTASWPSIAKDLAIGLFPEHIRGNFAFVWLSKAGDCVAAVDHISSCPLFISEQSISYNFKAVRDSLTDLKENNQFKASLKIYKGYNIDSSCLYHGMQRVLPCHYFKNGTLVKFIDLSFYFDEQEVNESEFSEIMEAAFLRQMQERNILFLSGGTDSALLAALAKKLNVQNKFEFYHIYTDKQIALEKDLIVKLAEKLKIDISYFLLNEQEFLQELSKMIKQLSTQWRDKQFFYKMFLLEKLKSATEENYAVFTGEIGDQLFGGPKLAAHIAFTTQAGSFSSLDIAKQYLNLSNNTWSGVNDSPLAVLFKKVEPESYSAYLAESEKVARIFESLKTHDLVNRFLNLNLVLKAPYRLDAYSQYPQTFVHPFADWQVVKYALSSRSSDKLGKRGLLKGIYYKIWRDYLIEEIWTAPKTGIPIELF